MLETSHPPTYYLPEDAFGDGVLRPAGVLMVSTPNRLTFSPGRDTPINPFHTRELNAAEPTELLLEAGFAEVTMYGLFPGPPLRPVA